MFRILLNFMTPVLRWELSFFIKYVGLSCNLCSVVDGRLVVHGQHYLDQMFRNEKCPYSHAFPFGIHLESSFKVSGWQVFITYGRVLIRLLIMCLGKRTSCAEKFLTKKTNVLFWET